MAVPLRIILVGFDNQILEPVKKAIKSGGYQALLTDVNTEQEWNIAVTNIPDVVVCSAEEGAFSGLKVLLRFKETKLKSPFLFVVSSDIGHAAALRGINEGASDYIIKNDLPRLPFAIKRAIAFKRSEDARDAAETFYRKLETSYEELLNGSNEGIYRATPDGLFIEVSPALVRLMGYKDADELLNAEGVKELLLAPCEQRPLDKDDTERILTLPARTGNGKEIWVEDQSKLVIDGQGEILYVEGIIRNVTDRKTAENALSRRERQYHAIFQEVQDAIIVLNSEGLILNVNPAANLLFKLDRRDMVGRPIKDFIAKKSISSYESVFEDAGKNGKSKISEIKMLKNKATFSAELKISRLKLQKLPNYMLVIRDISESARAKRAHTWLINGLSAVSAMVFITDARGLIRWVNDAAKLLTGLTSSEIIGKKPVKYIQAYDGEEFNLRLLNQSSKGRWNGRALIRRLNEPALPVQISVSNVLDDETESSLGYVFVCEDMSKVRNLEMQKASLEYEFTRRSPHEMLNIIASGFLGNLRYPLSVISAAASGHLKMMEDVLNREPDNAIALYDELDRGTYLMYRIKHKLRCLDHVIKHAFDYAMPSHDQIDDKCDLNKIISRTVDSFFLNVERRHNIEIIEEYYENPVVVAAKNSDIQLLLFNFMLNAIDVLEDVDNAKITIKTGRNDDNEFAWFKVIDNGPGMSDDELHRIGEAYFTTKEEDEKISEHGSGTGLGLYTSVRLIEMRRGLLEVNSEPGKTVFTVSFREIAPPSNKKGVKDD